MGVSPAPEMFDALLTRVDAVPGIEIRPTIVSMPGALGFWITEDVPFSRPDVIVRGREFAHLHPDGSLHASLSPTLASEAVAKGWAVAHPWAHLRPGWEGFVMIYTPVTAEELEVVFQLVVEGFNFVKEGDPTGAPVRRAAAPFTPVTPPPGASMICATC